MLVIHDKHEDEIVVKIVPIKLLFVYLVLSF